MRSLADLVEAQLSRGLKPSTLQSLQRLATSLRSDALRPALSVDDELATVVFDAIDREGHVPTVAELRVLTARLSQTSDASMAAFNELFLQAPVPVAILEGSRHVFRFANPAYRALVDGRDVVGKPLFEALPDLRGQGFDTLLDGVMKTGDTFYGHEREVKLAHHVGDERLIINFTYTALRAPTGDIIGVMVTCADVTEQVFSRRRAKQLADELRESEDRQRRVVAASGAGLWDLDVASGEIESDPRMTELMGLPPGMTFTLTTALDGLVDAADRAVVGEAVTAALRGDNDGRYLIEFRTGGQHGFPIRWVESRAQATFDSDNKATRLAGVMIDISPRKADEERREALVVELKRSNTALDQFAAVASHDMRAPLRGIALLCSFIEDDLGDAAPPAVRDHLTLMKSRIQRLYELVAGILEYSSASLVKEAGEESIDLKSALTGVVELLAPQAPATVNIDLPAALPAFTSSRIPLQQVVLNLVSNALKHSNRPDVEVTIAVRPAEGVFHFSVSDNGPGIPPELHDRIWEVFQRFGARGSESNGIGLAVVKRVVETRGGKVWVESRPGAGATFHFEWPHKL